MTENIKLYIFHILATYFVKKVKDKIDNNMFYIPLGNNGKLIAVILSVQYWLHFT